MAMFNSEVLVYQRVAQNLLVGLPHISLAYLEVIKNNAVFDQFSVGWSFANRGTIMNYTVTDG